MPMLILGHILIETRLPISFSKEVVYYAAPHMKSPKSYEMSREEAQDILTQRQAAKPELVRLYGPEVVNRIDELLARQTVRDIDMLLLTGDLGIEDAYQYVTAIDECRLDLLEAFEIGQKLGDRFSQKLPYYFQKTIGKDGELLGARIPKQGLKPRFDTRGNPAGLTRNHAVKVEGGLRDYVMSAQNLLAPLFIGEEGLWRDVLLEIILRKIARLIVLRCFNFASSLYPDKKGKLKRAQTNLYNLFDSLKPQFSFLVETVESLFRFMNVEADHTVSLSEAFPVNEDEVLDAITLQRLQDEVEELSCYRTIEPHYSDFGDLRMHVFLDNLNNNNQTRAVLLCMIAVAFGDKAKLPLDAIAKNTDEGLLVNTEDIIIFTLERITGTLRIEHSIGMDEVIGFDPRRVQKIKYEILSMLQQYLHNKEDDISVSPHCTERISEETHQNIAAVFDEQAPDNTSVNQSPELSIDSPPHLSASESDHFERGTLVGLKGSIVLRKLKRFLGDPIRIEGSHHVFTCLSTGACPTYPISLHGSKPVGVGMLMKCLKRFGIHPATFLSA